MRVLPSSVGAAAGAIALIVLLGSPPARTDATTPSDATNTESSAPLPKAQARFLSSTGVSEALGALRAPIEAGVGAESRADAAQILTIGIPHEFYFSRVAYSGRGGF